MLLKKIIKPLKIIYLIFATLITTSMLFIVPSFSAFGKDILIYKLSIFCFYTISFILPAVFILSQSIRKKIPLFKKDKLICTILGWSLLFIIGIIVSGGINSFHSVEYNVAKSKYDAVIKAKKIEDHKIKSEAKVKAQAKAKEEVDKAKEEAEVKAKEDAKAKEIADAKAVADAKIKADADANLKVVASDVTQGKVEPVNEINNNIQQDQIIKDLNLEGVEVKVNSEKTTIDTKEYFSFKNNVSSINVNNLGGRYWYKLEDWVTFNGVRSFRTFSYKLSDSGVVTVYNNKLEWVEDSKIYFFYRLNNGWIEQIGTRWQGEDKVHKKPILVMKENMDTLTEYVTEQSEFSKKTYKCIKIDELKLPNGSKYSDLIMIESYSFNKLAGGFLIRRYYLKGVGQVLAEIRTDTLDGEKIKEGKISLDGYSEKLGEPIFEYKTVNN